MAKSFQFPSLLSYCASIKPSIGFFYAVNNNEKQPVKVNAESIRGTVANYGADKKEKNPGRPNLQLVDRAYLPANYSSCRVEFTLNILANALTPHACNAPKEHQQLIKLVDLYSQKKGFDYLAALYAENIINGRWLWRNKSLSDKITIEVKLPESQLLFTLTRKDNKESISSTPDNAKQQLIQFIAENLSGKQSYGLIHVAGTFHAGSGQEIYPSQELPLDGEDKRGEYTKSRILAQIDEHAVLHSQKIGNALRSIDIWYPNADPLYPLAVEPFGVDSVLQTAHRADSKNSFYALLENNYDDYLAKLEQCNDASQLKDNDQQLHFVIACLIRGGVFSSKSE